MNSANSVILSSGEGDSFPVGPHRAWIKADGKDTTETYSVIEFVLAPQTSAAVPHRHPDWEEAFYVLEGDVEVLVGDRTVQCAPGSFVVIPRSTAHRVWNPGPGPAKILAIAQPWAPEYVKELAQTFTSEGPPDIEKVEEIYKKFGVEAVPES